MAEGGLAGRADSGLSVFVRGPDDLMELEKTSERCINSLRQQRETDFYIF